jgi:hypothetical protein
MRGLAVRPVDACCAFAYPKKSVYLQVNTRPISTRDDRSAKRSTSHSGRGGGCHPPGRPSQHGKILLPIAGSPAVRR